MAYRATRPGIERFESPPGGCAMVLLVALFFVPLWLIPIGLVIDGPRHAPALVTALAILDVLGWIALFAWASRGEVLEASDDGLTWTSYRALLGISLPERLLRHARWTDVRAALVRSLRARKNGRVDTIVRLRLTLSDGTHEIVSGAFRPWDRLLATLRERLGERFEEIDDHGALGAAVERLAGERRVEEKRDVRLGG